jgi:hypothetical protein
MAGCEPAWKLGLALAGAGSRRSDSETTEPNGTEAYDG